MYNVLMKLLFTFVILMFKPKNAAVVVSLILLALTYLLLHVGLDP